MEKTLTPKETQAIKLVARAVIEAVREAGPQGLPEGPLYMTLMSAIPGLTIEGYENLVTGLDHLNFLTRRNHVLYAK